MLFPKIVIKCIWMHIEIYEYKLFFNKTQILSLSIRDR